MKEDKAEKIARVRYAQEGRTWYQPSARFVFWWQPDGFNPVSGAQTGGHPAAYRKCVHRETKEVRHYGMSAVVAFNSQAYRNEYTQWLKGGMPERDNIADGTTATREEVRECMEKCKETLFGSTLLQGMS